MIILKSINLKNFLSHSDTTINFKENQKIIITGKSGSGKSSIIEGILWSLHNQGRGNNKFLIKSGESQATVILTLFDNSNNIYYKITRKIDNKNKHEVSVLEGNNIEELLPIKATGVREVQDFIEKEILHSSYLLFINSVLYPQNSSESFIYQTANKRKDIILEIAKTDNYDIYYKKSKELLSSNITESQVIKSTIKEKEYQIKENEINSSLISKYEEEKNRIDLELKKYSEEYQLLFNEKDSINKKVLLINTNVTRLNEINENVNSNETRLNNLNKKVEELEKVDKEYLEDKVKLLNIKNKELEEINEKQLKYFSWRDEMNKLIGSKPVERDYDSEIKSLNKQLIELMTTKIDSCPKCGFINPELEQNHNNRIKYLEEEITSREKSLSELKTELNIFNKKVESLGIVDPINNEIMSLLKNDIEELEKYEKQLIEVNSLEKVKEDIKKEIEDIKSEQIKLNNKRLDLEIELKDRGLYSKMLSDVISKISILESNQKSLSSLQMENHGKLMIAKNSLENIEKNKKELEELKKQQEKLLEDVDNLSLVKEAFSSNGIKSIVIDMLIPRLEDTINNTLSKLSDFRIKFETQKSGSGKDTVLEGLFISIINDSGEELSIENMSGGESVKISSAIFEGLASISNCSFRIMDETVIGLDSETISGFSEIMLQLQKNVSQLICVSHLDEIQSLFEEKLEVIKVNGNSKII